jgi:hypothetical protein
MRTMTATLFSLVVISSAARADSSDEPAYVPTQSAVAGFQSEWLPVGGFMYDGPDGTAAQSASPAWGLSAWIGWEPMDRLEIGAQVRYVAGEAPPGNTQFGHELDVSARFAAHSRPYDKIDTWFSLAPGWSSAHLPGGPMYAYPDPAGFILDVGLGIAYPIEGRLWGVATAGYQRGFQHSSEHVLGRTWASQQIEMTTDYAHVGVGLAVRF